MSEVATLGLLMHAANLARLLSPRTVAVVGANEALGMSNNAVLPMLEAGRSVHLVNPRRETLYGQAALPTLSAIGEPVDAVLGLVNAERSVELVQEAAQLGCGGVVVTAAGFAELGTEGEVLQQLLTKTARDGGLAVIGPNCAGFKNVPLGVNLFTGGRLDLTPGGVGVVSQSGFLVRAAMAAAADRQLGVSIAVSSGNEAVCDLADLVRVLAADPGTRVIALVIEAIRQPEPFFAAVAEARAQGKAVLALKLGRSQRSRRIVASHTGAIADESWVYELAFAEHGISSARDIDDLLDAAQLLSQLPPERRQPIAKIGIITTSGGVAALAADIADEVGAPVPPLEELEGWVRERVPGDTVNPLDLTGFVMTKRELTEELFERYADAVDLLVLAWWLGAGDEGWSTTLLEPFAAVAERHRTPFCVTPLEATSVGPWVLPWRERNLTFGRGIESVYRAVAALNRHLATRPRTALTTTVFPCTATRPPTTVATEVGPIATFAEAMRLLTEVGIPVAPHIVLDATPDALDGDLDDGAIADLGEVLVVKLADVPHRTELGAVAVGVPRAEVATEVARQRAVAATNGVPATIVIQPLIAGHGEAFAGVQGRTGLGPVVLFGMGGVLVEAAGRVRGRLLPVDEDAAAALVDEVAGPDAFARLRGRQPWAPAPLEATVLALGELWRRHGSWLDSLDINPLIVTDAGVVAVDALFVATPPAQMDHSGEDA